MITHLRGLRSLSWLLPLAAILFNTSISRAQTKVNPNQIGPGTFSGAYTHTGTETFTGLFQCKNLENVQCVDSTLSRGGVDIGDELNKAYAALPAGGGAIGIYAAPTGVKYSFSTPIVFATLKKPVRLFCIASGSSDNGAIGGSCQLNYTPTTATTAIQFDFLNTAGTGGVTGSVMDGISLTNNGCTTVGGCGSSATGILCGPTNSGCGHHEISNSMVSGFGNGITLSTNNGWGVTIRNVEFLSNTTGLNQTVGAENTRILGGRFELNGTGISAVSTEIYADGVSFDNNGVGYSGSGAAGTGIFQCTGCHFENPPVGVSCGGVPTYITGSPNQVKLIGGGMYDDCTTGNTTAAWINASSTSLIILGTDLLSQGRTSNSGVIQANGSTRGHIEFSQESSTVLTSLVTGTGATNITNTSFIANNSVTPNMWSFESTFKCPFAIGAAQFTPSAAACLHIKASAAATDLLRLEDTNNPLVIDQGPNVAVPGRMSWFSITGNHEMFGCASASPSSCIFPQGVVDLTEVAAPVGLASNDRCYGDSTLHAIKCSYNNGTFFQIPQVITATSSAFATATTAGTCVQNTTAVAGATTAMVVNVSPVSTPGVGAVWSGFVSSAGNITINECAVATSAGGTIAFNIRVTP